MDGSFKLGNFISRLKYEFSNQEFLPAKRCVVFNIKIAWKSPKVLPMHVTLSFANCVISEIAQTCSKSDQCSRQGKLFTKNPSNG